MIALLSVAWAAEVRLAAGVEGDVADPFVTYAGVRAAAEGEAMEWFGGGVALAAYPDLGDAGYRALTTAMAPFAAPDISGLRAMGAAYGVVAPVHGRVGRLDTSAGAVVGVGFVRTHDDLVLIGMEGEAAFEATQDEWHPGALLGLRGRVEGEHLGGQLRLERLTWQESFGPDLQERRMALFIGLDVVVRLGG